MGTVIGVIILSTLLALVFGVRSVLLDRKLDKLIAENEALSAEVVEMTSGEDEAEEEETEDKGDSVEPTGGETLATQISTTADAAETLDYQAMFPNLVTEPVAKTDDNNEKVIYLTFDDGPSETVTQQILDVLEEYDAHATFFVTAQYGTKEHRSEMYQAILDSGNTIGLHSYSHSYKKFTRPWNRIWRI